MEGPAIKTQSNFMHRQNCIEITFDAGSKIANRVGYYYAAAKVAYKSINLTSLFFKTVYAPITNLSNELRGTTELIEATRFFCSLNEFLCPDVNGVYFLKKLENTWQKIAERISFACHTCLKMVNALWQWGFIDLARIVRYTIGHLSIFKMVTDGLFAATSFFSVWDSKKQLERMHKANMELTKAVQVRQNALHMKMVTYMTKVIVVPLSMVFTAININTFACSLTLLGLGVLGDCVGLFRIFYEDYSK